MITATSQPRFQFSIDDGYSWHTIWGTVDLPFNVALQEFVSNYLTRADSANRMPDALRILHRRVGTRT